MPAIKEGENEKDYVSRCIPVRIREKGESPEQAAAACHGMYRQHKEKGTQYSDKREYMRLDLCNDGAITLDDDTAKIELSKPETAGDGKYEKYHAIAIVGDRFYKGKFFPATELNKAHIDGTIHDINHMATTFDVDMLGNPRQNIEYEVGFQKGQSYKDKKLHTEIYIKKDAPKYQAWKNHIDLCKDIGKTPNLSISFYHNTKQMLGKDLPEDTNFQEYGYTRDSMIPCITDVDIQALSTVFKGACTEKDGCGIGIEYGTVSDTGIKTGGFEQIIQKCIEETRKQNPGMSDEEIRRMCDLKYKESDRGGDRGDQEGVRLQQNMPLKDIKELGNIEINKKRIEINIEKEKLRGRKFYGRKNI